jgi:hypothetical protein
MYLTRIKKILLVTLLASLVSYNPGAIEKNNAVTDKLIPGNVRLTNSISSGKEYAAAEKTINSFMRKWSIAGASIAISKDGKLVYAKGFGFADTASSEETQPYHRFRIASISKLITAVAIMKLREEGKLTLNDRVFGPDGILNDPYFSNPRDKRVFGITVAHLLSHEGGWTQRWGDQMFMPLVIADKMGVKPPADTRTILRYALDKRLQECHMVSIAEKLFWNLLGSTIWFLLIILLQKKFRLKYRIMNRQMLFINLRFTGQENWLNQATVVTILKLWVVQEPGWQQHLT